MAPPTATAPPPLYVAGLDLGQAQDYTALAVLERAVPPPAAGRPPEARYAVRHLHRWHLGTKYTDVVRDLAGWFARPPLAGCALAVDHTGVGRAVVDQLRAADLKACLQPVTITAGHRATRDEEHHNWLLPKKDLVGVLQVLLQSGRLKVADRLEHAATLRRELQTFKVKVTAAANETFEAWRQNDHDDLVFAVALAAWLGERGVLWWPPPEPHPGNRSLFARAPRGVFADDGDEGDDDDGDGTRVLFRAPPPRP